MTATLLLLITSILSVYGKLGFGDPCKVGETCDIMKDTVRSAETCACRTPLISSTKMVGDVITTTYRFGVMTQQHENSGSKGVCSGKEGKPSNCYRLKKTAHEQYYDVAEQNAYSGYDPDYVQGHQHDGDNYYGYIAIIVSMLSFGLCSLIVCGCICIVVGLVGYRMLQNVPGQGKRASQVNHYNEQI
mmetsp:Transcript_9501/g.8538  ORF Transcript_9501/g.8538 Transcript_9501/m.8538 type:complete len:188 (+) Transcript_9501:85-648(+)|eukprot:CAMPEP_0201583650 /NCGR_PEP_ID=MMETSP0190_2-20130828/100920_1 /ASSEMBLY_ACC=CAM_ASM_000263 /TAXON_ID=37353 /ORGANISM="Rosalina sp." /LENGTH=187 /DNA_ID=CAMNT_0048025953 /DNA_START=85 /DNA_END=648 /DNA_ORIENTATION=-